MFWCIWCRLWLAYPKTRLPTANWAVFFFWWWDCTCLAVSLASRPSFLFCRKWRIVYSYEIMLSWKGNVSNIFFNRFVFFHRPPRNRPWFHGFAFGGWYGQKRWPSDFKSHKTHWPFRHHYFASASAFFHGRSGSNYRLGQARAHQSL